MDLIGDKDREHFVALHLNARNRVVAAETISIGSLVASIVHPREVFKAAILNNSAGIICGHNHPSGELEPSPEDRDINTRLRAAGRLLGIDVLDFLIVERQNGVSVHRGPCAEQVPNASAHGVASNVLTACLLLRSSS